MSGPLHRLRITRLKHRLESVDLLSVLRIVALGVVGAIILIDGVQRLWLDRALALVEPAARRAEVLASAMRLATVVAGVVGFSTFGDVWRNPESEILGRLPITGRALYSYRLVGSSGSSLLVWALAAASLVPVLRAGEPVLFAQSLATVTVTWALAVVWGLYWHMVAGAGVANPEVGALKQMSAGGVTSPERALLLYSPMFAVGTAFGVGFVFWLGLDGLSKGTGLGPVGVAAGAIGLGLGLKKGAEAFSQSYYAAAAALADGEALDSAFTSARPEPEYFGQRFVSLLPASVRPLVQRDLRQAWRRNRLVPWGFAGLAVALALFGPRLEGWLPAVVGAAAVLAGTEVFRMGSLGSDAPWFWLTLPTSPTRQIVGRWLAALLYPGLLLPGCLLGLQRAGAPPEALFAWGLALVALTVVAANLSMLSVGKVRGASAVYLLGSAGALVASGGLPEYVVLASVALLVLSLLGLARLRSRLAALEAAR